MTGSSTIPRNPQLHPESRPSSPPTNNAQAADYPDPNPECTSQEQGGEKESGPGDQLQPLPSISASTTHGEGNEEMVITSIRATDVALGLRRIPAGFYTAVQHSGREWRTAAKPVSAIDDNVEWGGPIPIPSDLSVTVYLEVCASFEFQPMLGTGEQLRRLTFTVKQLLDCSAKNFAFIFFQNDGDVVSPCSSLSVSVERRKHDDSDSLRARILDPHRPSMELSGKLEDATYRGHMALSRYRKCGNKRYLEYSIAQFEHALNVCSLDHPCRAAAQSNLATARLIHCRVEGTDQFLDVLLALYHSSLSARPAGHLDRPSTLIQLATVHFARFEKQRNEGDAAQAEGLLHEAIKLSSTEGHERRIATSLLHLHARRTKGVVQAGGQSSAQWNPATRLRDEDPWALGADLLRRFERVGDLNDLQHAILLLEPFVKSTPGWDSRYFSGLANLGTALLLRFRRLGEVSDLDQAISRLGDAGYLAPPGHPDKVRILDNLGNALLTRFYRLGELNNLEQAMSIFKDIVDFTPEGHPDKPHHLSSLGTSFDARYERLGELSDLEQAISRSSYSVSLCPDSHPHKPAFLNNLGGSLLSRYLHLRDLSDLEQAISCFGDAARLTPDHHPDKPGYLNNLGVTLMNRFDRIGNLSDLEQAIRWHRDAVESTPHGHPDKPIFLNSLGRCFTARFRRLGEINSIEQAILCYTDAVELTSDGHPLKLAILSGLGIACLARSQHLGELGYLEQAISRFENVIDLTPDGHPNKYAYLNNLAMSFQTRFERLHEPSDLEHTISLYSHIASASIGPIIARFAASLRWISCARAVAHHTLLHAYSSAIGLLPELAWIGSSLTLRYHELMQVSDLVREAAAVALDLGLPEMAVKWLEEGRSVVWGEHFQLRSSCEELSSVHPDHAHKLKQLSAALEHVSAIHEQSLSSLLELRPSAGHPATKSLEQEASRHRMLAIERDKLLQEIRRLPGFERFILQKEFSQLRASAHSGPVVFLNAAEHRCDALIVLADVENIIHVPFPNFNLGRSMDLQASLKTLVRDAHTIPPDEREGKSMPQELFSQWEFILSSLWKCVVKPVLDALAFTPGKQSRVFWCPTGPFTFLPIHAAGFYGGAQYSEPGHKVFDFVVSSYVPTLGILGPSPNLDAPSGGDLQFLTVRQPPSDGLFQLPGVDTELKHIRAIIGKYPSLRVTLTESSSGTVEEVLSLMKGADWVHFACHGIQDSGNPTNSGLCLADGRRLKLSDIIALSRHRGGLAFLSACQTATGDKNLSDEAVHIAAGMLFAGYGGVVGTMWSISDRLAPLVAKDVYEQLFREGTRPDYRGAARALQDAVGRVRDSGASFVEWLPFIHVGL